jgi:hypothetical protein
MERDVLTTWTQCRCSEKILVRLYAGHSRDGTTEMDFFKETSAVRSDTAAGLQA